MGHCPIQKKLRVPAAVLALGLAFGQVSLAATQLEIFRACLNRVMLSLKRPIEIGSQGPAKFRALASRALEVKSPDELLASLPKEWMANFTFMRAGSGTQFSSPEHPRAIAFSSSGDFFFTFNGHAHQRGNHTIEIMYFNTEHPSGKPQFELRTIEYKAGDHHSMLLPNEIEIQNEHVRVSKENPLKCMACHAAMGSTRVRPLWTQYLHWFGAEGEQDDRLGTRYDSPLGVPIVSDAMRNLRTKDRYSNLGWKEDPEYPYYSDDKNRTFARMPNSRLAIAVADRYAEQLAYELAENPVVLRFRNTILLKTLLLDKHSDAGLLAEVQPVQLLVTAGYLSPIPEAVLINKEIPQDLKKYSSLSDYNFGFNPFSELRMPEAMSGLILNHLAKILISRDPVLRQQVRFAKKPSTVDYIKGPTEPEFDALIDEMHTFGLEQSPENAALLAKIAAESEAELQGETPETLRRQFPLRRNLLVR